MRHCEVCGAPAPEDRTGVPSCPAHGPRWRYHRSTPTAAVVVAGPDGGPRLVEGDVALAEHPADAARRLAEAAVGARVELTGLVAVAVQPHPSEPDSTCLRTVFSALPEGRGAVPLPGGVPPGPSGEEPTDTTAPFHCDACGALAPPRPEEGVPTCPVHGPRPVLARNAPTAAAVIVGPDGRVLLARRAHEPYAGWWEVPGGFCDPGEHPVDAAVREVAEELGLAIRPIGLVGLYVSPSPGRAGQWLQHTVVLAEADGDPGHADPAEVLEWRWFDPAHVPDRLAGDHRRRIDDWRAGRTVALPPGWSARA